MAQTTLRIARDERKSLPRKLNFTVAALAAIKVPAGKDRVWTYDARTPHLAFMLTRSGERSFYWIGRNLGRSIKHRLGDGSLSIEQARNMAAERTADDAKGIDFHGQRKALRAEITFGELWTKYLEAYAKLQKRSWSKDVERHDKHLSGWASRRASSITIEDVTALHARIGSTHPGAANRTLSLISAIYSKTRMKCPNPARGVTRFPEKKRERALLPNEIKRFFDALKHTPQPWRDLFEIALLSGQRIGNIRSMRLDELSLDDGVWRIPGSKFKTGEPMTVALAPRVIEILKKRDEAGEWVFPAKSSAGFVQEPKGPWADLCERAGLTGVWIHDLRATNATIQAGLNISAFVIQKSLGHRSMQTTQGYVRMALDPVRASMAATATAMMTSGKAKKKAGK